MLVENVGDGVFKAWCHRCNQRGMHRVEQTLAERVAFIQQRQSGDLAASRPGVSADALGAELDPAVWPNHARLWLHRVGISTGDITAQRWGYLPKQDRVLLRVRGDFSEYWQARALPVPGQPQRYPKYLSATPRPADVFRFGHGYPVLTEDILSAFKVSMAGFMGVPIMGTSIPAVYIRFLLAHPACSLWLDPDAGGNRAVAKYIGPLRAAGIDARVIRSTKDPKVHFIQEIIQYVEDSKTPRSCV